MGATSDFKGCIALGPWGSSEDGDIWSYRPEGFIRNITVKFGDAVDLIEFQTYCSKGEIQSSKFGETGGTSTHTISIDYPNEYLMSISGTYGSFYPHSCVVNSLCFKTNQNLYGPYGSNSGISFSHEVKDNQVIVGFHGRAKSFLNAIGVYLMPKSLAYNGKLINELCSSMSSLGMPREAGPWGAGGGKPWDDGVFSAIKHLRIHVGELNVIYALQFEYLKKDGESVLSQIHGETDGSEVELVDLDDEYIVGISGFYGPVKGYVGLEAIASISFHTNKRILGPYGQEKGAGYVYYSSTASPGKVVGFQGRNNGFVSAIGVHMEYF